MAVKMSTSEEFFMTLAYEGREIERCSRQTSCLPFFLKTERLRVMASTNMRLHTPEWKLIATQAHSFVKKVFFCVHYVGASFGDVGAFLIAGTFSSF